MKSLSLRSDRLAFVPLGPVHVRAAHSLWTETEIREYLGSTLEKTIEEYPTPIRITPRRVRMY